MTAIANRSSSRPKFKALFIDQNQLARRTGNGRRGSRLTIHHGHFTENSVRPDNLQELVADPNLHFALIDNIHRRPRVALLKDDGIRRKAFDGLISEHLEFGHNTIACCRWKLESSTVRDNIVRVTIA